MVTVTVKCRHCGSENLSKNGFAPNGKQKYLCKDCKKASREDPTSNAYSQDFRELVLRACEERSSLRGAARTFSIHRHTISRWQEEKKTNSSSSWANSCLGARGWTCSGAWWDVVFCPKQETTSMAMAGHLSQDSASRGMCCWEEKSQKLSQTLEGFALQISQSASLQRFLESLQKSLGVFRDSGRKRQRTNKLYRTL